MKFLLEICLLTIPAVFCFLQSAFAHSSPTDYNSFFIGFSHPLNGADHILVMVAVGIWASQLGRKALWIVPISFVAAMEVGFMLALLGIRFPFVEPVILASVVAIGLISAMALKLSTYLAMAIVSVFAVFHGHAHGNELQLTGAAVYGSGFALATVLLHAAGMVFGLGTRFLVGKDSSENLTRTGGLLTMLAGLYLALFV
ncbi:MAG: urease accessory protein [Candidatus Tokpelaia sp. JSC085]|nr:MAG: urease accessory protein [Candidatus Tokpelaia sp. JSC085]